jgi:ubiquinone/menaquinone biosynthesis C-methylase UbiE
MLDVARRQYSAVTFDHADDAEAFPYHEGEFDAAFSDCGFHHVPQYFYGADRRGGPIQ